MKIWQSWMFVDKTTSIFPLFAVLSISPPLVFLALFYELCLFDRKVWNVQSRGCWVSLIHCSFLIPLESKNCCHRAKQRLRRAWKYGPKHQESKPTSINASKRPMRMWLTSMAIPLFLMFLEVSLKGRKWARSFALRSNRVSHSPLLPLTCRWCDQHQLFEMHRLQSLCVRLQCCSSTQFMPPSPPRPQASFVRVPTPSPLPTPIPWISKLLETASNVVNAQPPAPPPPSRRFPTCPECSKLFKTTRFFLSRSIPLFKPSCPTTTTIVWRTSYKRWMYRLWREMKALGGRHSWCIQHTSGLWSLSPSSLARVL